MQYLLTKEEYERLMLRAKSEEVIAQERVDRTKAMAVFLSTFSGYLVQLHRKTYDPVFDRYGHDQIVSSIRQFCMACNVNPDDALNALEKVKP